MLYVLLGLAALYLALLLGLYLGQEKIIFHPVKLADNYRFNFPYPFTEHFLETPDGARLNLLWFKQPQAKGLVLYYHGNADNLARWAGEAADIVPYGYDFIVWDYRGFGKSTGHLSQQILMADSELVYQFALKHYPESNMVVFGRSLGTGLATLMASSHAPRRLILETPYYNFADLIKYYAPPLTPAITLMRYHMPTDQWLQRVRCPVHIFHGTSDNIVPYASGEKLKQHLKPEDEFITFEGGEHHNLDEYFTYHQKLREILSHP